MSRVPEQKVTQRGEEDSGTCHPELEVAQPKGLHLHLHGQSGLPLRDGRPPHLPGSCSDSPPKIQAAEGESFSPLA